MIRAASFIGSRVISNDSLCVGYSRYSPRSVLCSLSDGAIIMLSVQLNLPILYNAAAMVRSRVLASSMAWLAQYTRISSIKARLVCLSLGKRRLASNENTSVPVT